MDFLNWVFLNNSVQQWAIALAVGIVSLIVLRLVRTILERQLRRFAGRTRTGIDDIFVAALRKTRSWFLILLAVWAGALMLTIPTDLRGGLGKLIILATLLQIAVWVNAAIRAFVERYSEEKKDSDPGSVTTIRALGFIGTLLAWAVLFLMALDNLDYDITALIAGLGIGGIAVALAVQNILSDLFASLSIVLDKPFVYGDFVDVDGMAGTIEHIGLKTTRVRSLSGEQLVFSNSDLLSSRIRNYKRMFERRIVFSFSVRYGTEPAKVERIPAFVRETIEGYSDTRFDRAHLSSFGESSLNFEVVYYMLVPDYGAYMDRQQAINLSILRHFEANEIEFGHPIRMVRVEQSSTDHSTV